jgi:plasmid stabilization system protein ParE
MAPAFIIFLPAALRAFHAAVRWYRARSPRAARRFVDAIDRAVERIAQAPEQGQACYTHYRWVRLRRFPYIIFYRTLDPYKVLIAAVAHGRRRPGYWLSRVRRK